MVSGAAGVAVVVTSVIALAAGAATAGPVTMAVAADPSASASTPSGPHTPPPTGGPDAGTITTLTRMDGRTDQFSVGYPAGGNPALQYVWYRPQLAPGAGYGPWVQLSARVVATRWPVLRPAENTDGRLEVFFSSDAIYRLAQVSPGGAWSEEYFAMNSPTWWGGPSLGTLPDGRLAYTQTTRYNSYDHEIGAWYLSQTTPSGPWGGWVYLGPGPFRVAVTSPSMTVDPLDGTVHLTASMWSAVTCVAHIDQLPGGGWSAWWIDPASPAGCG